MCDRRTAFGEIGGARPLEERYAYYRRCQVVRRNGEQCKAPAVKGGRICHKHAEQTETMQLRQEERRAVLELAVEMTRRAGVAISHPAELFMSFNGIQRTIAAAAQALIEGRIECKTAGRLAVELQTAAKLLRLLDKRTAETPRHGEQKILPQRNAEERRSDHRDIKTSGHREIEISDHQASGLSTASRDRSGHLESTSELRCSAVRGRGRRKMERWERRRVNSAEATNFGGWTGCVVRSRSAGRYDDLLRRPGRSIRGAQRW